MPAPVRARAWSSFKDPISEVPIDLVFVGHVFVVEPHGLGGLHQGFLGEPHVGQVVGSSYCFPMAR